MAGFGVGMEYLSSTPRPQVTYYERIRDLPGQHFQRVFLSRNSYCAGARQTRVHLNGILRG